MRREPTKVWLAPASAVILILIGGVIFGLQTNRWTFAEDVQQAAALLEDVPKTLGDWESKDITIPERQLKIAGAVGYVYREYRNRTDGRRVYVMLLCGSHGPISLHPPTVCFTGAGWKPKGMKRSTVKTRQGDELGRFQVGTFLRVRPTAAQQMITYWAWNANGQWDCPERPRFAYAGSPHLYKLYVSTIASVSNADDKLAEQQSEVCADFMRRLLPALKKVGI